MTKNKKKRDKVPKECRSNFSHVETDAIRATFIENPEKAKELGKEFEASTTIGLTRLKLDKSASAYRKLVKMEYTMQKTSTDIENSVSNA